MNVLKDDESLGRTLDEVLSDKEVVSKNGLWRNSINAATDIERLFYLQDAANSALGNAFITPTLDAFRCDLKAVVSICIAWILVLEKEMGISSSSYEDREKRLEEWCARLGAGFSSPQRVWDSLGFKLFGLIGEAASLLKRIDAFEGNPVAPVLRLEPRAELSAVLHVIALVAAQWRDNPISWQDIEERNDKGGS